MGAGDDDPFGSVSPPKLDDDPFGSVAPPQMDDDPMGGGAPDAQDDDPFGGAAPEEPNIAASSTLVSPGGMAPQDDGLGDDFDIPSPADMVTGKTMMSPGGPSLPPPEAPRDSGGEFGNIDLSAGMSVPPEPQDDYAPGAGGGSDFGQVDLGGGG